MTTSIFLALAAFGFQEIVALLITIGLPVLIFLVFRSFFLWYWKVNIVIENQEKQIELLRRLVNDRGINARHDSGTEANSGNTAR